MEMDLGTDTVSFCKYILQESGMGVRSFLTIFGTARSSIRRKQIYLAGGYC
jgi:hypothetical protein